MIMEQHIQGGLKNQQQKEQSSHRKSTVVKKILTLLLSAQSIISYGQHLTISGGAEKTVSGNQFGLTVMLETKKAWGVGTFYQTAISQNNEDHFVKDPFYGIDWQAPIARSERITFVGILRTGMVNQDFFAVVPSLETRIKLSRAAGVAVGAGIRSGYPSLAVKISIKLFQ
jgi:hypothetical protein